MRPAVRASNRVPCHRYATLIKGTYEADADGFSGISTHIIYVHVHVHVRSIRTSICHLSGAKADKELIFEC